MIEFQKAFESDAPVLRGVAIRAFEEDKMKYGSYPPWVDAESQHISFMKDADYFKIMKDKVIIGGVIVFSDGVGNYTLGGIFIEPSLQNQGIGKEAIKFIEHTFPKAKKWFLDTPYLSFRNHYFYEKKGYVKKGEVHPDENSDFCLFLYEKIVNDNKKKRNL